jgi:hypothetical protein
MLVPFVVCGRGGVLGAFAYAIDAVGHNLCRISARHYTKDENGCRRDPAIIDLILRSIGQAGLASETLLPQLHLVYHDVHVARAI